MSIFFLGEKQEKTQFRLCNFEIFENFTSLSSVKGIFLGTQQ